MTPPRFPKPVEGSWTEHYPDLGTGLVSYSDSISSEFYELEREAKSRRTGPTAEAILRRIGTVASGIG